MRDEHKVDIGGCKFVCNPGYMYCLEPSMIKFSMLFECGPPTSTSRPRSSCLSSSSTSVYQTKEKKKTGEAWKQG